MSVVETILENISSVNKDTIIELLKKHGTGDLDTLEDNVSVESLIFILKQKKFDIPEDFFVDLANLLGIPYVENDSIAENNGFVSILPYGFLKDNLIVPLKIDNNSAEFATANPFNKVGLTILEEIIEKKWDLKVYVASLEAIEKAIEHFYNELHKDSALWDLHYLNPDESAYKVSFHGKKASLCLQQYLF